MKKESEKEMENNVVKKRKEVEIEEEEEEISKDEKLSGSQMFGVWDLGSEWGPISRIATGG